MEDKPTKEDLWKIVRDLEADEKIEAAALEATINAALDDDDPAAYLEGRLIEMGVIEPGNDSDGQGNEPPPPDDKSKPPADKKKRRKRQPAERRPVCAPCSRQTGRKVLMTANGSSPVITFYRCDPSKGGCGATMQVTRPTDEQQPLPVEQTGFAPRRAG